MYYLFIKKMPVILIFIITLIIILITAYFIYAKSKARFGDKKSIEKYLSKLKDVTITKLGKDNLVFKGPNAKAAFIFYPGGFIDQYAYEPLMAALAHRGIMCIIHKSSPIPPFLAYNDSDGIKNKFPEIKNWYIGGHSLGGVCSSFYVSKHLNDFKGLVLLGAYTILNLVDTKLKVLSIYGSEDKVLNMKMYKKYKPSLPKDLVEFIIEGGCHSYFGMYGIQSGDGTPKISNEEQIEITVDKISQWIN